MMTAENCCVSAEENVGFSGIFPGRFFFFPNSTVINKIRIKIRINIYIWE